MRKFSLLLKKELKELITWQSVLPLLIGVLIMFFIGNIIGGLANEERKNYGKMAVLNSDDSEFTVKMLETLKKDYEVILIPDGIGDAEALEAIRNKEGLNSFIRIPKGFGAGIAEQGQAQEISAVTALKNLSITGSGNADSTANATAAIKDAITTELLLKAGKDAEFLKNPVIQKNKVYLNGKHADIDAASVVNAMMSQSMFLPIIMFIVITFASQMIAAAIANEKADKTLETLLSVPVSRTSVLVAKMTGAGIVALVYAALYMVSFSFYMNGLSGGAMASVPQAEGVSQALLALGLHLQALDYVIIGIQLFIGILIALSLSLIIGATAKDIKAAQAGVAPIIFLILIPYMLTLFTDIESLPFYAKALIYILPFTHSFTTMNNLFMGNGMGVLFGALYQLVFLVIMIWFAVRLFNSDKIFTLKLEFKKKKSSFAKRK